MPLNQNNNNNNNNYTIIPNILCCISAAICTMPCQNGGTCVLPDTCECTPTYRGDVCEECKYFTAIYVRICMWGVWEYVGSVGVE